MIALRIGGKIEGAEFDDALLAEGVPAICIEARHAQKILNETLNMSG